MYVWRKREIGIFYLIEKDENNSRHKKSGKKRTKVEEKEHKGYKRFRRKLTISRIQ